MGQGGKRQKTDRRDSAELVDGLDRYLRGQDKALSVVGVPSVEGEEKRALIRYHRQVMADRSRFEGAGKGCCAPKGSKCEAAGGRLKGGETPTEPRLKDWMKEQLEAWRKKLLSAERSKGSCAEDRSAGSGAAAQGSALYSTAVLEYEMKGWQRFHNREQVSSYTGLCPGIHQSDGRGKEGSINRCGNRVVRWNLVEMVWRLMVWQPHYGPVRQLAAGLVRSKRAKRRLVVKAARRLAIDLWRLATEQTTA